VTRQASRKTQRNEFEQCSTPRSKSQQARTGWRHAKLQGFALVTFALVCWHQAYANATPSAAEIDAYFRPYVATNNLSGSVLIKRGEKVLFAKSYGFADRSKSIPNRSETRFHIASLSILFTSTAVLRLIDQGKLSFDTHVSDIVPAVPNGDKISIRELLEQNSGLPDANDDLPNYDELLKAHQTPESLVAQIRSLRPFSDPGGKSRREEHSGQNLLALIIERKTGLTFAQAMKGLVFDPFGMRDSGADDDGPINGPVALGYHPAGPFGLTRVPAIHWSAKSGNGSAYTTVSDEWKWLQGLLHGNLLSESSRKAMLETSDGYGWWRRQSERLGEMAYASNGRAPGFSSRMVYVPGEDLVVIALTNVENELPPEIVPNVAALLLGKPHEAFRYHQVSAAVAGHPVGDFLFGPDFYRPSATLSLVSDASGVTLNWPGGPAAPLLPIGKDKFKDRYYWTDVTIVRGKNGEPVELDYGKFRGVRRSVPARN
jgi:CubicO group peptidase (beta-lactamase class C family)